jgi:peptide/nickel transport system substrate-binding protein
MRRLLKAGLVLGAVSLVAVAAAFASSNRQTAGTFVFGASADPVVLDPALISDGESFRVNNQIYETLISQAPGTTRLVPGLATKWSKSPNGLRWTFTLRRGVTFHDGTPFNAAAVCFNFDRWYNFKGALASSSASYYYNVVFGGFKNPGKGNLGPKNALYRSCRAVNDNTAVITLKRRFGPFLGALTLGPFSIGSPAALKQYGADQGHLTSDGVFVPDGSYGTQHPTGTGPFKFSSWKIGDRLELVRNDNYWGRKAILDRVIFRPISDNAARLQALQTGEIQGYDNVEPQDIKTVQNSGNLKVLNRPSFNVGYVTINQKIKPFDNLNVRKAVAYALDRNAVVKGFYAGRGVVANEFMPPSVPGYSRTVPKYPYNPARAKAMLQQAGLTLPVQVEFWYPTDVSRPYMPDPRRNFQAFAASLNKSGFKVVPKSAPWRPDYLGRVDQGTAGALNLIGWTGDYADPESFLGGVLRASKQFGLDNAIGKKLYADLDKALAEVSADKRNAQYKRINNYIMSNVIGVPYVHTTPALGFAKNVQGYYASPTLNDKFDLIRLS